MDPLWQTLLTIVCMSATYIWGRRVGFYVGIDEMQKICLVAFNKTDMYLDNDDMIKLVFIDADGKEWRSTHAFKS